MTLGRKLVYNYVQLPFHVRLNIWQQLGFRALHMDENDQQYAIEAFKWLALNAKEKLVIFSNKVYMARGVQSAL